MATATELDVYLKSLSIPIVGVSEGPPGTFSVSYAPEATPEQIVQGDQIANGWGGDPESGGTALLRRLAALRLDYRQELEILLRAIILELISELNILRQWDMAFKAEVAAATSLADLKTRVAGLPNLPDRTGAQARTAIKSRIEGGEADQ